MLTLGGADEFLLPIIPIAYAFSPVFPIKSSVICRILVHIRSCTNPGLRHTVHPSAKCAFNFTDKLGGSEQNSDTDKLVLRVFLWKEAKLRKRY